ncbi:hypothetical protein KO528_01380 [Saccharophagus degradans]|nr:hypothetical protein [Saccharophagus degradans]MBU2983989.1 hypothetical protein [Saccharophagus degradans]
MKIFAIVPLVVLLACCTTTKIVGQYPIHGIVQDKCSGKAISGVSIKLRFGAIDIGGDNSVITEPESTNQDGEFRIEPQYIKLKGGVGGWSGSLHEWPTVLLKRDGYKDVGYGFLEANESTYSSMTLTMEPHRGCP